MSANHVSHLRAWREHCGQSLASLAAESGVPELRLLAIERDEIDCYVFELRALAAALNVDIARLLEPPPASSADPFRTQVMAQMMRDICVEAVTTYEDMNRLDELRIAGDAEPYWLEIAELFSRSVHAITQVAEASGAFAPAKR